MGLVHGLVGSMALLFVYLVDRLVGVLQVFGLEVGGGCPSSFQGPDGGSGGVWVVGVRICQVGVVLLQ